MHDVPRALLDTSGEGRPVSRQHGGDSNPAAAAAAAAAASTLAFVALLEKDAGSKVKAFLYVSRGTVVLRVRVRVRVRVAAGRSDDVVI